MISKALVVGAYQRKLETLARQPDIELVAIVPARWREGRGATALERAYTSGYELIAAPVAFNGQFHLHFYPTLGRLLREIRPDVVHMDEEPYNLATWHGLRLAEAAGATSLFFTWQNLHRRYPWPFSHFEQANYRRAAYAIAGNHDAERVMRAKGYRGRVAIIPQFGVDPDIYAPAAPAPHAGFVVGYAGRLTAEKGIAVLLGACARLPEIGWTLRLLGDGPERGALEALAGGLGIGERVQFLGRRPSTQTVSFYQGLDALVLPSLTRPNWVEQFGRVLTEAMACGVPVIGSDSGEIPNVIGDAGLVTPEGDVEALSAALLSLAREPARRAELGARGRERVLARYTHEHIAEATAQVYRQIVSSR